jgi:hypothetical protein
MLRQIRQGEQLNEYLQILSQDFDGINHLDTNVKIDIKFWVSGSDLDKFAEELKFLINTYRI